MKWILYEMENKSVENAHMYSGLATAFKIFPFACLLMVSLLGNSLVIVTLSINEQRSKPRISSDVFIVNIAVLGLLECLTCQPISCGCCFDESWIQNDFVINFIAAFVQLKLVVVTCCICAIVVDRYLILNKKYNDDKFKFSIVSVILSWIVAIIFSIPVFLPDTLINLPTKLYQEKCICGFSDGSPFNYVLAVSTICFGLPIFLTLVFIAAGCKKLQKQKNINKSIGRVNFYEVYRLKNEGKFLRYSFSLILLYTLCIVPYLTQDILTQLGANMFAETTFSQYQIVLTWSLYLFSALFPLVTFYYFTAKLNTLEKTFKRSFPNKPSFDTHRLIPRRAWQRQCYERSIRRKRQLKRRERDKALDKHFHARHRKITTSSMTTAEVNIQGVSPMMRKLKAVEEGFQIPVLTMTEDGIIIGKERVIPNRVTPNNFNVIREKTRNEVVEEFQLDDYQQREEIVEISALKGISTIEGSELQGNSPMERSALHENSPTKKSSIQGNSPMEVPRSRNNTEETDAGYVGSDQNLDLNFSGNSTTLMLPFKHKTEAVVHEKKLEENSFAGNAKPGNGEMREKVFKPISVWNTNFYD